MFDDKLLHQAELDSDPSVCAAHIGVTANAGVVSRVAIFAPVSPVTRCSPDEPPRAPPAPPDILGNSYFRHP